MQTETFKHEASGVELCRKILQPHVTTFAEVFPSFRPYDSRETCLQWIVDGRDKMAVSSYCVIREPHQSLNVTLADWILSRIRESMLLIPNDRLFFEIVNHDNGWSLVVVSHGVIIGSRWLAYIKTDSLPKTYATQS